MEFLIPFSHKLTHFCTLLVLLLFSSCLTATKSYQPLDPSGNITIKWDLFQWTPDGYVATVTIYNYQQLRHIQAPGWTLGWTWAKKEVIWSVVGARIVEQGDCSSFKGNLPSSCKKDPKVVDLPLRTPYNMQIANCCKGGVISSWVQDPANAASSFQLSVGGAGTTNKTVQMPKNFTLRAPGSGYTCGAARIVKPTRFITADGRRVTQALMTWNATCTYSKFLAKKTPTCCVSLSAFYNSTITDCPHCACDCPNSSTKPGSCAKKDAPSLALSNGPGKRNSTQLVQCTSHMCPIRVHWHVKLNLKRYWMVKVTITNFNYRMNYPEWNLGVQYPGFNNLGLLYGSNFKSLASDSGKNDTAMLWGIQRYNDLLREAGPFGHVQFELLFRKNPSTFAFHKGWAFPHAVYFNGDYCVMLPPDAYPQKSNLE